jgi:hypothetical protein
VSLRCNKFKDGRMALNNDPQKQRGRPRTSHTDENCITVEGTGVNFSHQKQQSTATNTVKLSKNCVKPLNERDQDD